MEKKIEVKNIYKIFGSKRNKALELIKKGKTKDEILKETGCVVALNDVTFSVYQGETFVVMGLSGSGKSTLVRCINRLIEPNKGNILLDGEDVVKAEKDDLREIRRKKIGMVFQNFALFDHMTIIDNVAYGLKVQGVNKEERYNIAKETIDTVGLSGWEDSYPSQLSGGMQQRVGLARALTNNPDVLLMDEAFSALDPLIRSDMQEELLELQSKINVTIIFITHDLDEALKLGDRIALMNDGEVVQVGTSEEILTNPANEYVERFIKDIDKTKILTVSKVMEKPIAVAKTNDDSEAIINKMNKHKLKNIFLTDENNKLIGLIRKKELEKANKNNIQEIKTVTDQDFSKVNKDTSLEEIFSPLSSSNEPIAVVSSQNTLLGIIIRSNIIQLLAERGEA